MSTQLTVRLSAELHQSLLEASEVLRRKRSEVVRMALEQFLATTRSGSHAENVRGLLGSLQSDVPDLAENHRAYLIERLQRDD